jgi:opacity protein-like surface antigen
MNCKTIFQKRGLLLLMLGAGFALAHVTSANAQVAFGIKGGLSINSLYLDKDDDQVEVLSRPGFFFGPTVRLSLPLDGLGLDVAVLYEQRNAKHKSLELIPKGEHPTLVRHQQIAVPVNLRYDVDLNEMWGFYAYAGPQVGFNVGKEIRLDYGTYVPADVTVAINAGLGVALADHLQMSVGYLLCCGKTADIWINRGNPYAREIDKARIGGWQFGLCYFF